MWAYIFAIGNDTNVHFECNNHIILSGHTIYIRRSYDVIDI